MQPLLSLKVATLPYATSRYFTPSMNVARRSCWGVSFIHNSPSLEGMERVELILRWHSYLYIFQALSASKAYTAELLRSPTLKKWAPWIR